MNELNAAIEFLLCLMIIICVSIVVIVLTDRHKTVIFYEKLLRQVNRQLSNERITVAAERLLEQEQNQKHLSSEKTQPGSYPDRRSPERIHPRLMGLEEAHQYYVDPADGKIYPNRRKRT